MNAFLVLPALLGYYQFPPGTFEQTVGERSLGCADLDALLQASQLDEAIEVCLDQQFSCDGAAPFIGYATIKGTSAGDPQRGDQAQVRLEGSENWMPALLPKRFPQSSRPSTRHPVPVVGCSVMGPGPTRFLLSWASMRCRPVSEDGSFPAECQGGTTQARIADAKEAISFVDGLREHSRRELDLLTDPVTNHVTGYKTVLAALLCPRDDPNCFHYLATETVEGKAGAGGGGYHQRYPGGSYSDDATKQLVGSLVRASPATRVT